MVDVASGVVEGQKILALLVDDRELDLEITKDLIENSAPDSNLEVIALLSGFDAIKICEEQEFGFIFLDVRMPGIDGLETAAGIRKSKKNSRTPIIFLTSAFDDPEMFRKAYEIGASDFLPKPPTEQLMKSKLDLFISLTKSRNELQRARLVALEALHAKNNFLGVISHEIRTPLNLISCVAELIDSETDLKERQTFVEHLQASTKNLLHLVENLLDLAKIDVSSIELSKQPFDILGLIEQHLASYDFKLKKKSVEIKFVRPQSIPRFVIGDKLRITQVLSNLVNNSLKFTEKGWITVELSCKEDGKKPTKEYLIRVRDTGIGIASKDLEAIFSAFSQIDMTSTRRVGGLGIGLALTREIVQLMGGTLTVTSEKGKGSEFSFTLPLETVPALKLVPHPSQEVTNVVKLASDTDVPITLVIDDEPSNRKVADIYLRKFGITKVEFAENGIEGLAKFAAGDYDLVLMDLYMPEMDGNTCTKEIRKVEQSKGKSPALILGVTACSIVGEKEKMIASGCNEVLAKPLKKELLYQEIYNFIKERKAAG